MLGISRFVEYLIVLQRPAAIDCKIPSQASFVTTSARPNVNIQAAAIEVRITLQTRLPATHEPLSGQLDAQAHAGPVGRRHE
jgi:hypothetical protein